jgi:hypothetical protein
MDPHGLEWKCSQVKAERQPPPIYPLVNSLTGKGSVVFFSPQMYRVTARSSPLMAIFLTQIQ